MMHPAFRADPHAPRPTDARVSRRTWAGLHVLGPGAPEWVSEQGWPVPSQPYTLLEASADSAFTARISDQEFVLAAASPAALPAPPASDRTPRVWAFPRFDAVFELRGADWRQVTAQVCHYDFRALEPGVWLPVALAGVQVWCLRAPHGLWIGCDPSFGQDLEDTLRAVVGVPATGQGTQS